MLNFYAHKRVKSSLFAAATILIVAAISLLNILIPTKDAFAEGTQTITFADYNLCSRVASIWELSGSINNCGETTPSIIADSDKVASVTQLYLEVYTSGGELPKVSDLTGIDAFINLQTLYAPDNLITDISPLLSLINLQELVLGNNPISDFSVISNLTSLRYLAMGSTQMSNIPDLTNLVNLTNLNLSGNQISDISTITSLTNLVNLTNLDLSGNQISDISTITSLTNLQTLSLTKNQISNIPDLSSLSQLSGLYLGDNQISSTSSLSNLPTLTYLDLSGNQITSIPSLASAGSITSLNLENNPISTTTNLSEFTDLYTLNLSGTQINDISDLSSLTNLRFLYLNNTEISDFSPLSNFTDLSLLHLDNAHITTIPSLPGNLSYLSLNDNQITDISALANLWNLQSLSLNNNQIITISNLPTILSYLSLDDNQITDISALANLWNLQSLYLNNNKISNIEVLTSGILDNLYDVRLSGNHISDISPIMDRYFGAYVWGGLKDVLTDQTSTVAITGDYYELPTLYRAVNNTIYDNTADWVSTLRGELNLTNATFNEGNTSITITDTSAPATITVSGGRADGSVLTINSYSAEDRVIYFQDDGLCSAIYNSITSNYDYDLSRSNCSDSSPFIVINQDAIPEITTISASNSSITNLSGINAFYNLNSLDLSNNQISGSFDACEVYNLCNLSSLNLSNNYLTSVSGVSNIENLNLSHNQISSFNISYYYEGALRSIDLSYNQISGDIGIYDSPYITNINLSHNHITGANIEYMERLSTLDLSYNELSSTDNFYMNLYNLTSLNLSNNQLTALPNIPSSLTYLNLDNNKITDILPIAYQNFETISLANQSGEAVATGSEYSLPSLYRAANGTLDMTGMSTWVSNLSGSLSLENANFNDGNTGITIADMSNPATVSISGGSASGSTLTVGYYGNVNFQDINLCNAVVTSIIDTYGYTITNNCDKIVPSIVIDPGDLANVTSITASGQGASDGQKIRNLFGLQTFTGLTNLDLSYNAISDIYHFNYLPSSLQSLNLSYNSFSSYLYFSDYSFYLSNLNTLDLSHNEISSLYGIADRLPSLTSLNLSSNDSPYGFEGINNLYNLVDLDLSGNGLSSVPYLCNWTNLQTLNLGHNQIKNIDVDCFPQNLQTLYLNDNQISDISPIAWQNLNYVDLTNQEVLAIVFDDQYSLPSLYRAANGTLDMTGMSTWVSSLSGSISLENANFNDGNTSITIDDIYNPATITVSDGNANGSFISVQHVNGTPIAFEDPNFCQAVVTNIKNYYSYINFVDHCSEDSPSIIMRSDNIGDISALNATDQNISSISGIEAFYGLYSINFSNNNITNISSLSSLSNLNYVTLAENQITAIPQTLSSSLSELNLSTNHIKGIPQTLPSNLYNLNLSANDIIEIPQTLPSNLQILNLSSNQLTSIPTLSDLTRLSSLYLGDNKISDATNLTTLPNDNYYGNYRSIDLNHNQIDSIPDLSGKNGIQYLDLSHNLLTDISNIATLPSTEWPRINLNFSYNQLTSIPDLSNLYINLLNLSDNKISDVSGLANYYNYLNELNLSNNQIADISPIMRNYNIGYTDLSNQTATVEVENDQYTLPTLYQAIKNPFSLGEVADWVRGLQGELSLTNASWSSDTGITITDTSTPATISNYQWGNAGNSTLTVKYVHPITITFEDPAFCSAVVSSITNDYGYDITNNCEDSDPSITMNDTDIAGVTSLTIEGQDITSLSGIEAFTSLSQLSLSGDTLPDLSDLANLPGLTSLNLSDTDITDIPDLSDLEELEELNLEDNQISDISPIMGREFNNVNLRGQASTTTTDSKQFNLPSLYLAANNALDGEPAEWVDGLQGELELDNAELSEDGKSITIIDTSKPATITINGGNADGSTLTLTYTGSEDEGGDDEGGEEGKDDEGGEDDIEVPNTGTTTGDDNSASSILPYALLAGALTVAAIYYSVAKRSDKTTK